MSEQAARYLWRKTATAEWLVANEAQLQELTGGEFASIETPGRKRLRIEAPCRAKRDVEKLVALFGGKAEKLPATWLRDFLEATPSPPLRVGRRLIVARDEEAVLSIGRRGAAMLVIPAGAAFGTGDHATTAMSLRILERATRGLPAGWRMLDAGTGSGILALAAQRFGAGEVVGIDNDATAIATAKSNALLNGITHVRFAVGDVTQRLSGRYDIVAANLYSELLRTLMPSFRKALAPDGVLILSGVMRTQERPVLMTLRAAGFRVSETRRRGKWIALSARARSRDRIRNRADGSSPTRAKRG
ncbi:MAG TPA: 50S ribosomal protein L11 methyltransferase [Chthoniobacterales bacterium]